MVSESTPTQPNIVIKMCFAPVKNTGKFLWVTVPKMRVLTTKCSAAFFFLYEICLIWTFCQVLVHTWAVSDLEVFCFLLQMSK